MAPAAQEDNLLNLITAAADRQDHQLFGQAMVPVCLESSSSTGLFQ
jgi:hypothetical protein